MGTLGVLVALAGPWLLPTFMNPSDPQAAAVVELGVVLLWIAAGYQVFDGLNLGSGFALRGAGDVRVPALLFFLLSWGVFVPLAHSLSFAPGQGWFDVLPQFGFGAVGGWAALAGLRRPARQRAVPALALGGLATDAGSEKVTLLLFRST